MSWHDGPVRVRVPATSANLGPGFDSLGLALSVHDFISAEVTGGGLQIEVSGVGEQSATYGESHLAVRAMRAAFGRLGEQPPGIALRCDNAIPQGFGLGSSAAAITAGLLAGRELFGERGRELLPDAAVLHMAADLEGHADNVAACQAGGLTIAWTAGGSVRSTKLEPLSDLIPVLCVPAEPMATKKARQVLPEAVPYADAVHNAARAALLIASLTVDPRDLFDATEDFIHQSYRATSMPVSASLLGALRAANVPAVLSGAGPAVLALLAPLVTPEPDIVAAIAAATGEQWMVSVLDVDREGATVLTGDGLVG